MMDRVAAEMASPPEVVVVRGDPGDHTAYSALLDGPPPAKPAGAGRADAVRMVLYTSGTTGRPKGVLHTHNTLHALLRQIGEYWRIEPGDCLLGAPPLSHIGGSIYAFDSAAALGVRTVLMDRWEPAAARSTSWSPMAAPTWGRRPRSSTSCWPPPSRAASTCRR